MVQTDFKMDTRLVSNYHLKKNILSIAYVTYESDILALHAFKLVTGSAKPIVV